MNEYPDQRPMLMIDDEYDALSAIKNKEISAPELALAIAKLSSVGYSNRQTRELTGLTHDYTVSHYKKAGGLSPSILELWHKNLHVITLGHARALARLPENKQEHTCREILARHLNVRQVEKLNSATQSSSSEMNAHLKRLAETMSEYIGHPVKISMKPDSTSGKLTVDWFGFDDFDTLCNQLGFNPADHV